MHSAYVMPDWPRSRVSGWIAVAVAAVTIAALALFAPSASAQTPQVEKAFSPASVSLGDTTTLTFTIDNPDLQPHSWSFTDDLDTGLSVASVAHSTNCSATTVTAPLGATSIQAAGTVAFGQPECTIAVRLAATRVGTLTNGASNFSTLTGLLAPTQSAQLACAAPDDDTSGLGDVFSSCPFNDTPPATDFTIQEAWRTTGTTTVSYQTPVVGDLFGNGKPAIVVGSNRTRTDGGVHDGRLARDLQVYDGATGALLQTVVTPRYSWTSHAAATIADLDGDGDGEIVFRAASHSQGQVDADAAGVPTAADVAGRLIAYEFDSDSGQWQVMWVSDQRYDHVPDVTATAGARGGHGVGIADFNGDGVPEAYVGNQVFNARTGARVAAGAATDPSGCAFTVGAAHCMWGQVAAADIDGDGKLELAAGNAIYKVEIDNPAGEAGNSMPIWRQADPINGNVRDGYTAVADMNVDGTPDVVVSARSGSEATATVVYAWDGRTGAILGLRAGGQMVGANGSRGGPPMVGDIDGDGRPEVVAITTNRLRAFQVVPGAATPAAGLVEEWTLTTADGSGTTSMSMFDFNNDGRQEIVYRDEQNIRILDGGPSPADPTTRNLTTFACGSGTGMEMPVIADVDGSREARIVVNCESSSAGLDGNLRAYETASFPWANTRPVWNQQSYFVAHVNDDLTVPANQFEHWTVFSDPHQRCSNGANRPLNAFQQQVTDLDGETGCPVECADPELVVSKTSDPPDGSFVTPGQTIRYEIEIENPSEGDGFGVVVTDDLGDVLDDATLSGGPTVDPPSAGTASVSGDTLTFTGDVFRDQTVTVAYEVTVHALEEMVDGDLGNVVSAEYSGCPGDEGCQTRHRVISLTKDATPRTAVAGTEVTYTYRLGGTGLTGRPIDFRDVLPAGMSYVPGGVAVTPPFGAVNAYGDSDTLEVSGTLAALPTTISARVALAPDAGCGGELDNQAGLAFDDDGGDPLTVASDDPTTADHLDPTTVEVSCHADLALSKSGPAVVEPGEPVAWTIAVTNDGPSDSSGSTVTDTLPPEVSDPQTSTPGCTIEDGVLSCDVGPLAVGDSHEIEVTADAPDGPSICFANAASVTGDDTDPEPGNDSASARTCTPPVSDLEIEKTGPDVVEPGSEVAWTLTVRNNGPFVSPGSTVTDTLPPGVSNPQTSTPGCAIAAGVVTCAVGALDIGDTHAIVVTGDAPQTFSTCFENVARVVGDEGDSNMDNNESRLRTCTDPLADLSLRKLGPATVDPGGQVSWTITVTNDGPDPSSGSTVTDVLPAAVSNPQTSTPGCAIVGVVVACAVGPLAVDDTHEIVVTADAPDSYSTCFDNTATVAGDEEDPDAGNDSATASTCTRDVDADLSIAKSGPPTVDPGASVSWTISVTNDGRDASTGSTVTDTLPSEVSNPRTSTPGCAIAGGVVTCAVGPLAVDDTHEIVVTADAPASYSTCFENSVAVDGDDADPDGTDNGASVDTCTRDARPDLSLAKSGPETALTGGSIAWTLTVANAGPDPSTGSTVTDALPAGVSDPRTDTPGCAIEDHVLTCDVGPLTTGETHTISVVADVAAAAEECVENTASLTANEEDPTPEDATSTWETCIEPGADLGLAKSGPAVVAPGGEVSWTLTVTNAGPELSSGSTVTDVLPAGLTDPRIDSEGCAIADGVVSCEVGTLEVGASRELVVTADAPQAPSTCFENAATVAGAEGDPGPADNEASVRTCTTEPPPAPPEPTPPDPAPAPAPAPGPQPKPSAPRVSIAKHARGSTAYLGSVVAYRITIRNRGGAPAHGLRVCDRPPPGLRILRAPKAKRARDGGACWRVKRLAPGAARHFYVTAQVESAAPLGLLRNRAIVHGLNVRPARARAGVRVRSTPGACSAVRARASC